MWGFVYDDVYIIAVFDEFFTALLLMLAYLLILLANIYFFVASVYNVKSSGYTVIFREL